MPRAALVRATTKCSTAFYNEGLFYQFWLVNVYWQMAGYRADINLSRMLLDGVGVAIVNHLFLLQMFLRTQKNNHLVSSLLLETTPTIRATINHTLLVTEMLSPLTGIISPSFRMVHIHTHTRFTSDSL